MSIGEIFDRAITLLVRHWQPFFIIGAIGVLPAQLSSYLASAVSPVFALVALVAFVPLLAVPVTLAAVVAQIYRAEPTDWRKAFLVGLQRIPGLLGASITMMLITILPLLILVGIPAGAGAFRFSNPIGDVAGAIFGLIGVAIFLSASFAVSYAAAAMAIDDCGAMDAVGRALDLFREMPTAGRTLLFALAQALIAVGGQMLAGALQYGIATYVHAAPLAYGIEAVVMFVAELLSGVLVAAFYFDVAIRREGYDMQVALEAMPG